MYMSDDIRRAGRRIARLTESGSEVVDCDNVAAGAYGRQAQSAQTSVDNIK